MPRPPGKLLILTSFPTHLFEIGGYLTPIWFLRVLTILKFSIQFYFCLFFYTSGIFEIWGHLPLIWPLRETTAPWVLKIFKFSIKVDFGLFNHTLFLDLLKSEAIYLCYDLQEKLWLPDYLGSSDSFSDRFWLPEYLLPQYTGRFWPLITHLEFYLWNDLQEKL